MDLVSWVFQDVPYDKHRPIIIDASNINRSLSIHELRKQVRQLIAGLKHVGVRPGDCVCVNAFNDISYTVLYLSIIGAGAIFSGINPGYSVPEISRHINLVNAKFMIAEPKLLEKSEAGAASCGLASSSIFALDVHDVCTHNIIRSWSTLFQYGECDPFTPSDPNTTTASYQTSSGTSGLPKAAMISHSYLIDQARLQMTQTPTSYEPIRLTALPPMHVFATPIIPASIRSGIPIYVMRRYDLSEFIHAIEKYKISETWLPPPPVIAIPKSKLASKASLQSLRRVTFGGGTVTYENQLKFYELLHEDARINAVWGMTEVGWVTAVSYPDKQSDDSVGKALDGYKLRIIDNDGKILHDSNSTGELQILAPHPMLGYLNNPEADKETFSIDAEGRWINSGDIGYINTTGDVFIVDRKKDLIKVRGWQVSPAEVESRLQQHGDVSDVGVIGVPLGDGEGELVRAYVVRQHDSAITADELKDFTLGALARYKCPQEIVFTEAVPRNPTGKVLRRVLREQSLSQRDTRDVETGRSLAEGTKLAGSSSWMVGAQKWWSWVLSVVKT